MSRKIWNPYDTPCVTIPSPAEARRNRQAYLQRKYMRSILFKAFLIWLLTVIGTAMLTVELMTHHNIPFITP